MGVLFKTKDFKKTFACRFTRRTLRTCVSAANGRVIGACKVGLWGRGTRDAETLQSKARAVETLPGQEAICMKGEENAGFFDTNILATLLTRTSRINAVGQRCFYRRKLRPDASSLVLSYFRSSTFQLLLGP